MNTHRSYFVLLIVIVLVGFLVAREHPMFCSIEVRKETISPTKEYVVEVSTEFCNFLYTQTEVTLRSARQLTNEGTYAEVLWKARGRTGADVTVTWADDSTIRIRIPAGSRGTLEPEFDRIKVIYDEYR